MLHASVQIAQSKTEEWRMLSRVSNLKLNDRLFDDRTFLNCLIRILHKLCTRLLVIKILILTPQQLLNFYFVVDHFNHYCPTKKSIS